MKKAIILLAAILFVMPSCIESSYTQEYNIGIIPGVSAYNFESNESLAKVKDYFKQKGFTNSSVVFTGVNIYDCDKQAADYFKDLVKNITPADIKTSCGLADSDFFEWLIVAFADHVYVIEEFRYNILE
ncbi:MAG: hypothetical protein J6Z27_02790 [Bacteroidales bacterium]|nr:hypothetical protein [Bacteroidales bacterium]